VSFSRTFGFLEAGRDDGTLEKIELALRSLASVGQTPWLFWVDYYLSQLIGPYFNLNLRHGLIRKYASKEVEARRTRPSKHDDILGGLFKIQKEKGKEALDDDAITSIATANVFAGSDTTAISLRAIVHFLLTNPQCLQRLKHETRERKEDGRLTWPATFSQVSDWPYLQAIISESLRLHPAVGLSLPRVVPEGGTIIDGKHIAAGVSQPLTLKILDRSLLTWYIRPQWESMLG
jgi:cytochrome P450